MREQSGQIVRHRKRWYVRYWEHRLQDGILKRKRINHYIAAVTTRGKRVPPDIEQAAKEHMATVKGSAIPPDRIVTIADFAKHVYLPWVERQKRPSTSKSYRDIWEDHLREVCGDCWLKDTRTYHVQGWLDQIGKVGPSRNSLKHIKSVVSGMFTLAKQQNYFDGINPAQGTAVNPSATEPKETYAYSLEEIRTILSLLPEPASTTFAVAAYAGLRHGEIQGLLWENYDKGEIFVSRSIWNGRVSDPKTRSGRAAVPVIRQLAERLDIHRMRAGNPVSGPMFPNAAGKPKALSSVVNRIILPALNRYQVCGSSEQNHRKAGHLYARDEHFPEWKGWHAARRGLGSNLYRLGIPEKVIQRILRHANVSTTATYYIKTAADDVRAAMTKLEEHIPESKFDVQDTIGTPKSKMAVEPSTVQ